MLYEERRPLLDINDAAIDNWFEKITLGLSEKQQSDLKAKYGKKGPVYGSGNRIDLIAWDIAVHFKTNFKDLDLGLKGQIATDSKVDFAARVVTPNAATISWAGFQPLLDRIVAVLADHASKQAASASAAPAAAAPASP